MRRTIGLAIAAALLGCTAAQAQDAVADFYRGKQIQLRIGFPPGSGYDLAGRVVASYLGKYIPGNPTIVVQNVDGAGSLTLANQLYNTAPHDGTVIGLVSNVMPTAPLLSPDAAHYDVTKFSWIGSNAPETDIVIAWHTSPVKTIDDLFTKGLVVGASGVGGAIYEMPIVMNALVGTKFKVISGYAGSAQIALATERGEVQGQAALGWTSVKSHNMDQVRDGRLRIIAQYGLTKNPDLPDVPLFDLPKDETDRQALLLMFSRQEYGRPLLLPPGVPSDRVAAIRQAFQSEMKDPALLAEASKAELEIDPVSGETLDRLTQEVMRTNIDAVSRLRTLLDPNRARKD
jgi:tripartite-type tricarboxylate transporter receptor subunit TctC